MGISAYVKEKDKTVEETLEPETEVPGWFGYSTQAMSDVEEFAELAGIDTLWGWYEMPWIPRDRAAEHAAKLRRFLAEIEPGPPGSLTDKGMCDFAEEVLSFLEIAAKHDGYVVD